MWWRLKLSLLHLKELDLELDYLDRARVAHPWSTGFRFECSLALKAPFSFTSISKVVVDGHCLVTLQLQFTLKIRLDNFLTNSTHGKFRLLSPGKVISHSTALPSWVFLVCFFLCAVFNFKCFHTTSCECEAYSFSFIFMTDGLWDLL